MLTKKLIAIGTVSAILIGAGRRGNAETAKSSASISEPGLERTAEGEAELLGPGPSDGDKADSVLTLNPGPFTWVNAATGRCLDSHNDGSPYTLGCNGGNNQQWSMGKLSVGEQIFNQQTRRCLDSNASGNVYTLPCSGNMYQQWVRTFTTGRGWKIVDAATGRCLDSNGSGSLYTLPCNGGSYQYWW